MSEIYFNLVQWILKYIKCIASVSVLLIALHPSRHSRQYEYVEIHKILDEFAPIGTETDNLTNNLSKCPYEYVIGNNREIARTKLWKVQEFENPNIGGEHIPKNCISYNKTAILVPYRNRKEHLRVFINFMHSFLQRQYVSYRIFIIEQNNTFAFNRAKLFNIGALEAIRLKFLCLILTDIDLLPLNTGNIYTCSKLPRHMCSSLDTFRYNLPYKTLFGGVVSIRAEQFKRINGMSNQYMGWGGEDDDLYRRLAFYNFTPYRFSPEVSKYTMLKHSKEQPSKERFKKLHKAEERFKVDGLNSLSNNYTVIPKRLFTHIFVN